MADDPGDAQARQSLPDPVPAPDDPVPDAVAARARAVFDQLVAPGELASLVYDSLAEGATSAERFWLVFQHRDAQLQLSITPHDERFELRGRIDPPGALRAELELDGSDVALVEPSVRGEFTFRAVPPGVMRVGLSDAAGASVLQTDWFLLGARHSH